MVNPHYLQQQDRFTAIVTEVTNTYADLCDQDGAWRPRLSPTEVALLEHYGLVVDLTTGHIHAPHDAHPAPDLDWDAAARHLHEVFDANEADAIQSDAEDDLNHIVARTILMTLRFLYNVGDRSPALYQQITELQ